MKKLNANVTMYRHGDFIVTIEETADEFSAWLRLKNYGVQMLMFGWPKVQPTGETYDYDAFMELVDGNFDDYAEIYCEEYCEE